MTILLTGSRGKTSSRIAALLEAAKVSYIVASRSPDTNCPNQVRFDWLDDSTHSDALTDQDGSPVTTVWLVPPPVMDLAPPVNKFIDLAASRSVRSFVLLSASILDQGGPAMGQIHAHLASLRGIEYTVLRPTWFMENFSSPTEFYAKTIQAQNAIYSATGDGKVPFISVDDIARVAALALQGKVAANRDYILLGPELLSYDQVAEALSKATGRKITHVHMNTSELAKKLVDAGMDVKEEAEMHASMDGIIQSGAEERLNTVVRDLTGTKPRTFAEFVAEVWQ